MKLRKTTGKRGMMFTVDAALAVILVFFVMTGYAVYPYMPSNFALEYVDLAQVGQGTVSIMQQESYINISDVNATKDWIEFVLPVGYAMALNVSTYNLNSPYTLDENVTINLELPDETPIYSGKTHTIVYDAGVATKYMIVHYWIWRDLI